MYKISLTYGDPSADGHGISETDYYTTNYSLKKIVEAVAKTEATLGFTFDRDVCCEYEDCSLTVAQAQAFTDVGINVSDYSEDDGEYVCDFTGLYLAVAKVNLPDLEISFVEDNSDNLDIGGYGLCSAG